MYTTTKDIKELFLNIARERPLKSSAALIQKYPHLFELAENGEQAKPVTDDGSLQIRDFLSAQANDFHGRGPVREPARKSAVKLKNLVTINNWFNIGTTGSFLGSLFSPLGLLIGAPLAAGAAIVLLGVTNISGERAAARNPKNKGSSKVYLWLYTTVSLTLTGISGIGTLLMLEQPKLADALAQTVVKEQIEVPLQEELNRREKDPLLTEKTEECNAARQKISQLPEGSRERNDLYFWYLGPFEAPPEYWESYPFEQMPVCQQVAFLEGDISQQQETLTELQAMLAEQGAKSTLKQQSPQLFDDHFTDEGRIKSGSDAIRTAFDFTWQKLTEPDWMALGSSGVTFVISLVLTVGTIGAIIQHSKNKDVQASHDLTVKRVRDQFFNELISAIQNLPDA